MYMFVPWYVSNCFANPATVPVFFGPQTSILVALGRNFGTPGLHFGVFLVALVPLGPHLGHVAQIAVFCSVESSFLLAQKESQNPKESQHKCKQWVSRK